MSEQAPHRVVRRFFDARAAGDVRTALALIDPAVRAAFAPDPTADRRVEVDAHRVEPVDADHVDVHGRIRVFDGASLSDSPAAWRFTVRAGRIVDVAPRSSEPRLRRVA